MSADPAKSPKKPKDKGQTPEEKLRAARRNHMLYGPTAGERSLVQKKTNLGTAYLKHPKFQSLMAAFAKGTAFQFEVTDKGKPHIVSTDGTQILFDGRMIYYSRPSNRYEEHLLMDRAAVVQFQGIEAFIHLVVAVIRHFPELGPPRLTYLNHQFYDGATLLEDGIAEQGPNLLIGSYKHMKSAERTVK